MFVSEFLIGCRDVIEWFDSLCVFVPQDELDENWEVLAEPVQTVMGVCICAWVDITRIFWSKMFF